MLFVLEDIAIERGFAHRDHLCSELTSTQLVDLLAHYQIRAQGDDYWRQPAMMSAAQIKGTIGQIKQQRQKAKEKKRGRRNSSNPEHRG